MKVLAPNASHKGMTLLEVLVVLFVIAILAAMLLPASTGPSKAPLVTCMSHLKQTGLGFVIYADDNGGKFPMQPSAAPGDTTAIISSGHTFPTFQKIQKYVPNPGNLICPVDKTRLAATNYASLSDLNISYFLNVDAATNNPAQTILAGDRYLQIDGRPVNSGLFFLSTNLSLSWSPRYHHNKGILAFSDDHVEISTSIKLPASLQNQPLATNRLSLP